MDDFFKNLKEKLSVDNIVGFMKDGKEELLRVRTRISCYFWWRASQFANDSYLSSLAKVIDEHHIKEEDVRKTLEKIDPNNIVDADEIATKLNEISEQSKAAIQDVKSQSNRLLDTAKSSLTVLQKPSNTEHVAEDDDPYTKHDNVLAFFD